MTNSGGTVTLLDFLGLDALQIDRKLLSMVGNTEIIPYEKIRDEDHINRKVVIGDNLTPKDIYQSVDEVDVNCVIQKQNDHFVCHLLTAAIIKKYPDVFLKSPMATILRSQFNDQLTSCEIPFSASSDKQRVMELTEAFLQSNERLVAIKNNVLLIANEFMTNALYCAPTDSKGAPLYINSDRSSAVQYKNNLSAEISLSFNEEILVIGCRDPFGSVNKPQVTRRLNEVFKNPQAAVNKNDANKTGAGLGLKLVIESSTCFGMVVRESKETFVYAAVPLGKGHKSILSMKKNLCFNFY